MGTGLEKDMILIYAYIGKYKNYVSQEICFDHEYQVTFRDGRLSIQYYGKDPVKEILRRTTKPDNLHLLVGKTGSGKTNLLQLIGMKYETRVQRKWDGEDDSYFLLYKVSEKEFLAEICDVRIHQFPEERQTSVSDFPESLKQNAKRIDTVRTVRFSVGSVPAPGDQLSEFTVVSDHAEDLTVIVNSYDVHTFLTPPYADDTKNPDTPQDDWIYRRIRPYHRTSLWSVCHYIREYQSKVETGAGKRQVSFVLSTHNFAGQYPLQLPDKIEQEYWAFNEQLRDEQLAEFDEEAAERVKRRKRNRSLTDKQMFIHDLWTDYAKYLRKWILKIHNFNGDPAKQPADAHQQLTDWYAGKIYQDRIDPSRLPDGIKLSIPRRCNWLAQYIDRVDNGDPHGVLWQIVDDIRDICRILEQLDDRYFTVDTFSIPVVDMALPKNQELFYDLFERMEAYEPDDAGIFTEKLLPYAFTHLSTGEYQYAKVLGGLDESMRLFSGAPGHPKPDKIILMDEPETYMHPELARQFLTKLYEVMREYACDAKVQIIIGTHSPFMLSDVLPSETTRLDIDRRTGNAVVNNGSDKAYFAANIHTILADGFFLEFTIGEYARKYLQDAFDRLDHYAHREGELDEEAKTFVRQMRLLLPYIGDKLINRSFEIMLNQLDA